MKRHGCQGGSDPRSDIPTATYVARSMVPTSTLCLDYPRLPPNNHRSSISMAVCPSHPPGLLIILFVLRHFHRPSKEHGSQPSRSIKCGWISPVRTYRVVPMASQSLQLSVDLQELNVPARYLSAIPSLSVHTPVSTFWFHVLQERQSTLIFPTALASFSKSPPSAAYNPSMLARDPIPPAKYLQLLKKHLDGLPDDTRLQLRSVCNPACSGELLPLWAVTVWDEVSTLRDSRDIWNNAHSWVKSLQATQQHENRTRAAFVHFTTLGWSAPLSHYGLKGITTLALPQFLSDNCINDEAIDLMAHLISSKNTLPSNVLIAPLSLSNFISSIHIKDALLSPSPSHIQQIEQQFPHISKLYFPSFYAEHRHWIAFKVDIVRKEVTYSRFRTSSVFIDPF